MHRLIVMAAALMWLAGSSGGVHAAASSSLKSTLEAYLQGTYDASAAVYNDFDDVSVHDHDQNGSSSHNTSNHLHDVGYAVAWLPPNEVKPCAAWAIAATTSIQPGCSKATDEPPKRTL